MTRQVGILVYDDVEVLDFAGPFEVFSTASRVAARLAPPGSAAAPFTVVLLAETAAPIRARAGLLVQPHHALAEHPPLDVLVVPGGVHEPVMERPAVIAWLQRQLATTPLVASVCTGAFLLARAGLPDGTEVTTHWEDVANLRRAFPALRVREDVRWVEHPRLAFSAGISAGLDLSLRLVARLEGQALAERAARQMDYAWEQRAPA